MSLFQRKAEEKRSIEEIFTPKDESEKEIEPSESDLVAEEETEIEPIEIKSESAEEFTENALDCFGWKEIKTEKWLVKSAKIWYGIMSLLWFVFGAFTFAPIVFISKKVNVIFKSKKKSLFVGIGIYALIVAVITLIIIARTATNITTP